ncbi:ParB N-terminal domain-containing protein [Paenibacillus peoriae]|uniref:ParB N-terminal domain-containing protein n=1 Tax=Paenibacillus peoriae TaxID=59893 RepID=UPI00096F074E|nr:ParB N-terminal domain-containing protein [Paenibacillus peoriae]
MYERAIAKEMFASELTLSKTNPRFPKPVNSEEEAILTFFELKKVGPKKIEALIQDIIETGGVLQDFIVLHTNNEYIVYDGNRRLTALKLLMNDTAKLIKAKYPSTYRFIENVKHSVDIESLALYTKVYSDPEAMANHVIKIHSGEQSGAGQITWSSNEKDTFTAQFIGQQFNLGNLIYRKLEVDPNNKELYGKIKNESYATTFERIFGFLDIRTRIFNLERGKKVDLDNPKHFDKVCEMIKFFISNKAKANVGDVYTAESANNYFANILPINMGIGPDDESGTGGPGGGTGGPGGGTGGSGGGTGGTGGSGGGTGGTGGSGGGTGGSSGGTGGSGGGTGGSGGGTGGSGGGTGGSGGGTGGSGGGTGGSGTYSLVLNLKSTKKSLKLYNDYDLKELIEVATDSNGENLKDRVVFNLDGNLIKENHIFSGDAQIGTYTVQVKLQNNGYSVSKSVEINVSLSSKGIQINQPKNEFFKSLAAFTDGEVNININNTVNMLINEIQSLENAQDYRYMIASSVRQLLELSIEKVIKDKNLRNHGNPKQNLIFLIEHLSEKTLLTLICNGENKLRYQAIKNLLGSMEADKLYDYLNLITHSSYAAMYDELVERVNLRITPILVLFHNYLHLV